MLHSKSGKVLRSIFSLSIEHDQYAFRLNIATAIPCVYMYMYIHHTGVWVIYSTDIHTCVCTCKGLN